MRRKTCRCRSLTLNPRPHGWVDLGALNQKATSAEAPFCLMSGPRGGNVQMTTIMPNNRT
jgi:hypothetical protein